MYNWGFRGLWGLRGWKNPFFEGGFLRKKPSLRENPWGAPLWASFSPKGPM